MSENALAPVRTWICTECRVRLAEGQACYLDADHETLPLDTETGRKALVRRVWYGPLAVLFTPESQLPIAVLCVAVMVSAAVAPTLWLGLLLFLGPPFLVLVVTLFLPSLLSARSPRGTSAHALLPLPTRKLLRGRISAKEQISAPLSDRPCAGFAVSLCAAEYSYGDVFLRDAHIAEVRVELEDGRYLDLPAGPIRLEMETFDRIADPEAIARYLDEISQTLTADSKNPPVPYEQAWEGLLRDGDTVWLIGEVTSGAVSYRESGMAMSFVDAPHLRLDQTGARKR